MPQISALSGFAQFIVLHRALWLLRIVVHSLNFQTFFRCSVMTSATTMSPELSYPEWQREYQAALLELDRAQLRERVEAAETAIYKRLGDVPRLRHTGGT